MENHSYNITENVYWVGDLDQINALHCNPYLLVDNDEAVLIDPGSTIDFEQVFYNVQSLVPIEKIKYVVLSHQDPDLCGGLPLWEKRGLQAELVTHWRASVIISYYNIESDFYLVDQNMFKLVLSSGRTINFFQAPYLHFPGAITSFDGQTGTLFSGDLFGAFSERWDLYAQDDYMEKMTTFHEHYMPGNEILRPVMEQLRRLSIQRIAPQHGSIISKNVDRYIKALENLECGKFLTTVKRELAETGGYSGLCDKVLTRLYATFNPVEVKAVFENSDIRLSGETGLIEDFNSTGKELWNHLFELIYAEKGQGWLSVVEVFAKKLSSEFDVELPQVLQSTLLRVEQEKVGLIEERDRLREVNKQLEESLNSTKNELITCPVTGLYNEPFFTRFFTSEVEKTITKREDTGLLLFSLDNISHINFEIGKDKGNEFLHDLGFYLMSIKEENHLVFKLDGPVFAYFIPRAKREEVLNLAEKIRNEVSESESFLHPITVSVGAVLLSEFVSTENLQEGVSPLEEQAREVAFHIIDAAKTRVRKAKQMGTDIVCSESEVDAYEDVVDLVLLVDSDYVNTDIIHTALSRINIHVEIARDGEEALRSIEHFTPDLVVCEAMVPKINGFMLRQKMLEQSSTKQIPFILMSYQKDEESVERAFSLHITAFLKRPFLLAELIGYVKSVVGKE